MQYNNKRGLGIQIGYVGMFFFFQILELQLERLKWLSNGSDDRGLELFGNFFIFMSDTWARMMQRLGFAGAVDRSTSTWPVHVEVPL